MQQDTLGGKSFGIVAYVLGTKFMLLVVLGGLIHLCRIVLIEFDRTS